MELSSAVDNRRLERVSATVPISLLLDWGDSETECDAYTVDISRKGARVRSVFILSPGQMVGIAFEGDSVQAIPSRIVWVERSSTGSLAGLEFLDTGQA
jgi:hypothetical protein